jgi:phospholipid/cholesterol/gamma-HCH transport system substrate-binding protein
LKLESNCTMKQKGSYFKLGIFVAIGLALFIFAVYTIGKNQRLFGTGFRLRTVFHDVSGLQVGNNVRFSGINIGVVREINIISDSLVSVEMLIDGQVKGFIKKDSKAVIGSEGLMGNKLINILPGSPMAESVKDNDKIRSDRAIDLENILSTFYHVIENVEIITDDLSTIIESVAQGRGVIGSLLMDTAAAGNLESAIKNIQRGTRGFEENMEALKDNFLLRGHFKRREREEERQERRQQRLESREQRREGRRGIFQGRRDIEE